MSWRDDLPDIPSDRIRRDVLAEGRQRRAAAVRRRRTIIAGSSVAAASLLLVVGGLAVLPDRDDEDGDAAMTTDAAADTVAATAAEATTADTGASDTTEPAVETIPPARDVRAEPTTVWEVPASGAPCGPTSLTVAASLDPDASATVIARTSDGLRVEEPMTRAGNTASATFAGFPPGSVGSGERADLFLEVVVEDAAGRTSSVAGPVVELRDCTR